MLRFVARCAILLLALGKSSAAWAEASACMQQFPGLSNALEFRTAASDRPGSEGDRRQVGADPDSDSYRMKAADSNAAAINDLGLDYLQGKTVARNLAEAFKCFSIAARQENLQAQYNLGVMYATGQGVEQNDKTAANWFMLAADQGAADAQNLLGMMFEAGCGLRRNDVEAARRYRLAAEAGLTSAQDNLGRLYLEGRAAPSDASVTRRWSDLLTSHKSPEAAFILGMEQSKLANYREAAIWLRLAATLEHAAAYHPLAVMYDTGSGIWQNPAEAARWYLKAAHLGDAKAQHSIGLMYGTGRGVERDLVQAWVWLDIAAKQGIESAAEDRELIAKQMPRPRFYEAQRLKTDMLQLKGIIAK